MRGIAERIEDAFTGHINEARADGLALCEYTSPRPYGTDMMCFPSQPKQKLRDFAAHTGSVYRRRREAQQAQRETQTPALTGILKHLCSKTPVNAGVCFF
jgi:hypothetical protein